MAYLPTGAGTYLLQSSIGSTDTTITLSSFTEPVSGTTYTMANIGTDIVYATIAPKTANSEFISFTGITQNSDGTATLTGVTRGLSRSTPFTSSVTFKLPHSGQTQLILSNSPQQLNEYVTKRDDQTISGLITFSQPPVGINPGGQPNASTSVAGIVQEATQAQVDARTAIGSSGAQLFINPSNARARNYNDLVSESGSGNTYTISPSISISAYAAGQVFSFIASHANTSAATLNVNSKGAIPIVKNFNVALVANDILVGQIVTVEYDAANAQFQMISNLGNPSMPLGYLDTTVTLGGSDTKVPSQNAVKTYVDNNPPTSKNGIDASRYADDADGTQTIAHGLGRTPKKVRITAFSLAGITVSTPAQSIGAYDGTNQSCDYVVGYKSGYTTIGLGNSNAYSVRISASTDFGLSVQSGVITVDGTNITITWTYSHAGGGNDNPHVLIYLMWEAQ